METCFQSFKDPGLAPALGELLYDPSVNVRQAAAWLLTRVDAIGALPHLKGAVRDSSPVVREQVAWALASIQGGGAGELLRILLDDPVIRVRQAARKGLERRGEPTSKMFKPKS